jgi:protein-disulfide isomerase
MNSSVWESVLVLPVLPQRDHIRGPIEAPVTLVEYGDYECPYCGAAHPITEAVQAVMDDEIRFVFRHFPLTTMHPHAAGAAEAAEAAGAQGQFWAMHDLLYANQDHLDAPDLLRYAEALSLDLGRFVGDLTEHAHARKVHEDFLSGVRSGVNGTPTFFINGVRHEGAWDYDSLLAAVQRAAAA